MAGPDGTEVMAAETAKGSGKESCLPRIVRRAAYCVQHTVGMAALRRRQQQGGRLALAFPESFLAQSFYS